MSILSEFAATRRSEGSGAEFQRRGGGGLSEPFCCEVEPAISYGYGIDVVFKEDIAVSLVVEAYDCAPVEEVIT